MFRTLAIRTGLLCLALAPFVAGASAQVKVAVINTQKAMAESDELKKASAAVEAKYKPRQDELTRLQADMQSIEQQLASGKLNQQAAADLTGAGSAQTARRAAAFQTICRPISTATVRIFSAKPRRRCRR